ncbi:unnamed protein product [Acanthosepion pharaonis]|uniref:Uncharacterized protein n=1 Tax=Acanthosepion pharaonis TaxID=158019 RepID=A0A812BMV0_ACAPH|nr:unnamed protein product [Sepia pharaonis]
MNPLTLVLLSLAVFLQLLSIAIPYWISNSIFHSGLWNICIKDKCTSLKNEQDFFKAFQSLQVLGLVAGICGILTILIGNFTKLLRPEVARLLAAVHCIAAGAIILIGIMDYGVKGFSMSACFIMSLLSSFACVTKTKNRFFFLFLSPLFLSFSFSSFSFFFFLLFFFLFLSPLFLSFSFSSFSFFFFLLFFFLFLSPLIT